MNKSRIFDEHISALHRELFYGGQTLKSVPTEIKIILGKNRFGEPMWRERHCEKLNETVTFRSFGEFVEASPPRGLGATIEVLKDICQHDPEARDMIDEAARNPEGRPPETVNNVNGYRPQGNARDRALRHLRDKRPDLHKRVLAKEISPHAAMVEAGFRKRSFTVPDDPDAAAETLARRFGELGIAALIAALQAKLRRAA